MKMKVNSTHKTVILYLSVLILALIATACSGPQRKAPMDIDVFNLVSSLSTDTSVQKALFHPQSGTVYAMSTASQQISIYRDSKRVNVVGGLGTGTANFRNLSDIALSMEGKLLALDSVAKSLKIFSDDGKAIGEMELKGCAQPVALAAGSDQNVYVYDAASAEIIVYSVLDGAELFRFGKFELPQVSQLGCNRDYVTAYDAVNDKSHIFTALGQFVKQEDGQTLYDDYNNGINLKDGLLLSQMSPASLSMGVNNGTLTLSGDILVLVFGQEIRMLKIGYTQVR